MSHMAASGDYFVVCGNMNKLFRLAIMVLFSCTPGIVWAGDDPDASYNRPNPLMDYVSQELGIYDAVYWEFKEADCRDCHGNSLADRHHANERVVVHGECSYCHPQVEDPSGVKITRNCMSTDGTRQDDGTVTGCHSTNETYSGGTASHGWHHATDLANTGQCTGCHGSTVINETLPLAELTAYPISATTPTPFSCENCHWAQDVVTAGKAPATVTWVQADIATWNVPLAPNMVALRVSANVFVPGDRVYITTTPVAGLNNQFHTVGAAGPLGGGGWIGLLTPQPGAGVPTWPAFNLWVPGPFPNSLTVSYANSTMANVPHPSTLSHFNAWQQSTDYDDVTDLPVLDGFPGDYHEYGKPIYHSHFNMCYQKYFAGSPFFEHCGNCHEYSFGPKPEDYEGDIEEQKKLIRFCQRCHNGLDLDGDDTSDPSIHSIYAHLGLVDTDSGLPEFGWQWQGHGWVATGFHVAGGVYDPAQVPTSGITSQGVPQAPYRPLTADGNMDNYPNPPTGDPNIDNRDGMCWGCHGDDVDPFTDIPPAAPALAATDPLAPTSGCCGLSLIIRGQDFGQEHDSLGLPKREVRMWAVIDKDAYLTTYPSATIQDALYGPFAASTIYNAPIVEWSPTYIEAQIPCGLWNPDSPTYSPFPINLWVFVTTEVGKTAITTFTLQDCSDALSPASISPTEGICRTLLTISNSSGVFGSSVTTCDGSGMCVARVLDFVSSGGTYTLIDGPGRTNIVSWSNTQIDIVFRDFFEDTSPRSG
jgi:hypothetical protein